EGVSVSTEAVKERVIRLSSERLRRSKGGQIALTERQIRIVEFINQRGKITNRDMRNLFSVSSQAAHKEIKKLLKLGVVKPVGRSRGLYYELT
ncbi:MAG: HTH domain-containing protein, partial [Candidatus Marinimicrobia bacterium]|nr:HTH domain-containing protein [Candidatus Neomarinimicrobiota bacterium]